MLTIPKTKTNEKLLEHTISFHEEVVDTNNKDTLNINIAELQYLTINDLVAFLQKYKKHTSKNQILVDRIITPLLNRAETISDLGLGYLSLTRQV